MPTPKSSGAEGNLIKSLGSSRKSVEGNALPLWSETPHNTSTFSAFSADYKKSLTSCRYCSNGSCPTCKMRRAITPEGKASDGNNTVKQDEVLLATGLEGLILDEKGGPGSGYFGPRPSEGDHDWGGSAPREGGSDPLKRAVDQRVKFRKNRLAKEVISHASRIKQIEEKAFRTPKDRFEARRHAKELRNKLKELDIPEDKVWETIEGLPPQQQAYLASLSSVQKNDSKAVKILKNLGKHAGLSGLSYIIGKKDKNGEYLFAPSPLSEPETIKKMSIAETVAYLTAHGDPRFGIQFVKALGEGDIDAAKRIRQRGAQDIISNWTRNIRDDNFIDAATEVHREIIQKQKKNKNYYVTQREREKMIMQRLRERSDEALRAHRSKPGRIAGRPDRSPTGLSEILGIGGKL